VVQAKAQGVIVVQGQAHYSDNISKLDYGRDFWVFGLLARLYAASFIKKRRRDEVSAASRDCTVYPHSYMKPVGTISRSLSNCTCGPRRSFCAKRLIAS
jgi:hypothetical protein